MKQKLRRARDGGHHVVVERVAELQLKPQHGVQQVVAWCANAAPVRSAAHVEAGIVEVFDVFDVVTIAFLFDAFVFFGRVDRREVGGGGAGSDEERQGREQRSAHGVSVVMKTR
jgi:hypothetical protein